MKQIFLLFVAFSLAFIANAQQPYAGCYHPEHVKAWKPGVDPNDVFNRGTIKLQKRYVDKTIKANANAKFSKALIAPDLTLTKNCSKGFSQGKNSFDEMYIFNYWQYVDMVIWWGGSAGEGVFVCPTATAIDAAHKNGVKILGNIFFAPSAYGGQSKWVEETLEKDSQGNYIIAQKLIDMAKYFGFDGWFLNDETTHFSNSGEWEKWCTYYSKHSDGLELQMYNATSKFEAEQKWMLRNSAGEQTGTSYFVNYGGTGGVNSYGSLAESIGASKFDLFYGINQGTSAFAGNGSIQNVLPEKGSLAPFMERVTWRCGKSDDQYNLNKDYIINFFKYSNKYWSGNLESNPSVNGSDAWPGISSYTPARTFITEKPFYTSFNTGYGVKRCVKGEDKGVIGQKWVHQGIQDILPTWRWWWIDNSNRLNSEFTLDEAYEGGSSIKIDGDLTANVAKELRLYKMKMPIANGDKLKLVSKHNKTGKSIISVGLAFADDINNFIYLATDAASGNWDIKQFDLSAYAGKTLVMVSLKYESSEAITGLESYIGQLGINGSDALSCGSVSNITIQNELGVQEGDLRLTWDAATGNVLYYNIYLTKNGDKKLVGQTESTAFYISKIQRDNIDEESVKVEIVPVTPDFEEQAPTSADIKWKTPDKPVVKMVASSTFAKSGSEITFTVSATNYPTSYTWTMPTDAVLIEENENKTVVKYKFPNEGIFDVSVTVGSKQGSTVLEKKGLITINNSKKLENVALNKPIIEETGHFGSEQPSNLVDGITNQGGHAKWCFGGLKEHSVVIDLENTYELYKTRIVDCEVNEPGQPNLQYYKIFTSLTNAEGSWTEVVHETDRKADNIKVDYFAGTVARYIKFVPYDPKEKITIRVWEFEAYGLSSPLTLSTPEKVIFSDKNKTKTITLDYSLGGMAKESNFNIEVATATDEDNNLISISNFNTTDDKITFDITSKEHGLANYNVSLTNGKWVNKVTGIVGIDNNKWINVLKGIIGTPIDGANYSEPEGELSSITDEDISTFYVGAMPLKTMKFDLGKKCNVYKLSGKFTKDKGQFSGFNKLPKTFTLKYSINDEDESSHTISVNEQGEFNSFIPKTEMRYMTISCPLESFEYIGLYEFQAFGEDASTAINDVESNVSLFSITPNPVDNKAMINISLNKTGDVDLFIYDITGSLIANQKIGNIGVGYHTIELSSNVINKLTKGVYVIVAKTPYGRNRIKFIKK